MYIKFELLGFYFCFRILGKFFKGKFFYNDVISYNYDNDYLWKLIFSFDWFINDNFINKNYNFSVDNIY